MRGKNNSIANTLISEEEIRSKLPSIFTDSIILDSGFRMVVVSNNVLTLLEFRASELYGKSINYITGSFDFSTFLASSLQSGFFQEKYVEIFPKSNKPILTSISGFHLGLISDINGYIILKMLDAQDLHSVKKELETKRVELDNFIYRTAHDLRGPLATIRGLINLYCMKKDEFEVDQLIQLISLHANQLDEKLFKLLYLAEADQPFGEPAYILDVKELEAYLRKKIEVNSYGYFSDFHVHALTQKISGINEGLMFSLAVNILHFLLNLPKSTLHNRQLIFFLSRSEDVVDLKIFAKGFEINEETRTILHSSETFYGDMLIHPELFNYFAALKIALRLKASIHMNITNPFDHEILITIPLNK